MNFIQYNLDPMECEDEFCVKMLCQIPGKTKYCLPLPPPMWQLCPIHLAVETPMHLQMNFIHYNANFTFSWA